MKFEIIHTPFGYRFVLLDGTGKPIMTASRTYTRARDVERAIRRVQAQALWAPVEGV